VSGLFVYGPDGEDLSGEAGLITRQHAIAVAQNIGRKQGYAVGVHGSRVRDLDLLAAPWTEETAITPLMLAEAIASALPGALKGAPERKPHGRLGFIILPRWRYGFDSWYVDLSVMPRRRKRTR
jgi:hypothetical protein